MRLNSVCLQLNSAQNFWSDFFSDFALSFDNMNGTAAAASKAQPNIGRNRIQPIAITTNENEVAIATHAKLTPSPIMSRTIGIQDTEKNRYLDENFSAWSS